MPNFISGLFTRSRTSSRASQPTFDPNADLTEEPDSKTLLGIPSDNIHTDNVPPPYSREPTPSGSISGGFLTKFKTRTDSEYYRTPLRRESLENALEVLRDFDVVVVVDDSGSMQGSLWAEARLALSSIADTASKFDEDGIDIHFINSKKEGLNVKSSRQVMDLFDSIRPYGSTYLGRTLDVLLGDYLDEIEAAKPDKVALRKIKPKNFIVITDGEPSDDPEEVIANAAKRLDAGKFPLAQLGIQLVQIGRGEEAKRYLNILDNALTEKYQIRDIVDTTPYFGQISHDALIKIMLGGINRKMDRSKA